MLQRARHDRGASAVEYAILLAFVALVALGGLKLVGGAASGSLSDSQAGLATSTTVEGAPATTPTTRPAGVPRDWPANKPIPPMPANCRQPQLEDDGVWNCQH